MSEGLDNDKWLTSSRPLISQTADQPPARSMQGGPKIGTILYALTLSNINRFSKLVYCQNQEKICNNTITKDTTVPQALLHYLVKCQVS